MFERFLEPGCTESPACQCSGEMQIEAMRRSRKEPTQRSEYTGVMSVSAKCG
jgi:hypothetical protein